MSARSEVERGNTLAMMRASRQNYFLLDSAKFEKDALLQITGWQQVNQIVTDNKLPEDIAQRYHEASLIDAWGNTINKSSNARVLDVRNVPSGNYLLIIIGERGRFSKKIIIAR